jgi:hypothetical protein
LELHVRESWPAVRVSLYARVFEEKHRSKYFFNLEIVWMRRVYELWSLGVASFLRVGVAVGGGLIFGI